MSRMSIAYYRTTYKNTLQKRLSKKILENDTMFSDSVYCLNIRETTVLTLILVGFIGVRFAMGVVVVVGGGGGGGGGGGCRVEGEVKLRPRNLKIDT